ncbi:PD-(D/E)XK nuclease family protein [Neobacillus terrae]|uniref:PD-(D/E)XK nuclease family protein n=1 Tax=Neobacillus terrae TaxID=3034837 RepID=UPI001408CD2C|nr:PD-(D/E)XK nuclease family protein [Neobacillus terrae]
MKVFIVIEFLYRDIISEKWVIVDWKTGKESAEDRNQLALYALYLKKKFKAPLEKIEIRNESLLTSKCRTYSLTDFDLDTVNERVQLSCLEMGKYLIDEEENIPVGIEYFPRTSYEKKCIKSNFLEMCNS